MESVESSQVGPEDAGMAEQKDPSLGAPEDSGGEAESSGVAPGDSKGGAEEGEIRSHLAHLENVLHAGLTSLQQTFESRLTYDRFKEKQIDRLHEELQEHKRDLLARTIRPLIHSLIRLHDDLGRTVEALAAKPAEELTRDRFFRTFEGFADDLRLLLADHGVRTFEVPEDAFEPRQQTAVRRVKTTDIEQVGRVAERLRPGFAQGDDLLQKERVAVYVATAGAPEAPDTPGNTTAEGPET